MMIGKLRIGSLFQRLATVAALVYMSIILIVAWRQIQDLNWKPDIVLVAMSLILYLISLLLQLHVWLGFLAARRPIGLLDVRIYWQTLLMRRLPGGFWHWIGRASLYQGTCVRAARSILAINIADWLFLLVACGVTLLAVLSAWPLALRAALMVVGVVFGIALGVYWSEWKPVSFNRIVRVGSWLTADMLAWLSGGIIVWLVGSSFSASPLSLVESTRIWCISGGVSTLIFIFPAGLGIREFTLSWLLSFFMPLPNAIAVSIVIRLIFTLADMLWGLSGFYVTKTIEDNKLDKAQI